ncbi:hypothetical protein MUG87_18670 [Ectobacillus sp. JY-23]|uniref:hypothetical protein n=1 Tax=Ectobacillus sp. JY-23 TaxID=2933872 RepID=UPI001FF3F443|nr:hypothetical protein [Ectobacillus sp. JY-23]UOY92418.1 hypothetical protein MUG87_18670 [Ectobacillus sp. JY-23]
MKKLRALALTVGVVTSVAALPTSSLAASNNLPYINEIKKLQPGVSQAELISSINEIAKNTGNTKEQIAKQILQELKKNDAKGIEESRKGIRAQGGGGGTVPVGPSSVGNIFYTASQTAYLNHGHVGMYSSKEKIVESVPGDGVRTKTAKERKVDKGDAVIKSVNTSSTNKQNAAKWALGRVGVDSYSYNFATNRHTSHYGAKNCSKLIWSAYQLNGKLDLDVDGGAGVYPRDVRDAKQTSVVRKI